MNSKSFLNEWSDKPNIPFIVGPTASGKTELALEIAKKYNGEIVSADSMQIYKYMDIGTAKPTIDQRQLVPHHLVDFLEPDDSYSVADYYKDATVAINNILSQGKLPIVCGGTGLYINALSKSFILDINSEDIQVRKQLEREAKTEEGRNRLYKRLQEVDPIAAQKIHPHNIKRVIRALEIFEVTGEPKSALEKNRIETELPYIPRLFMKQFDRAVLYDRIDQRVDQMLEMGLVDEVRELDKRYPRNLQSLQALGYKEFFPYFDGKISLDEAIRILKRDTRHYAKRQLTWFRHDKRIEILN